MDGAFKQTTNMKWAHLLCAMWIPEVSLGNTTFQEPVQDVEKVPKTRWKLVSKLSSFTKSIDTNVRCRVATSVGKRWAPAFNAVTNLASRLSTLPAHGKQNYA
jgi:hypothetical protein